MKEYLAAGTWVILSGYEHRKQQEIVKQWLEDFQIEIVQVTSIDTGLVALRIKEDSQNSSGEGTSLASSTPVSLIITVFNREEFLSRTIESILTQTHKNFELIIWDDGSTDDSLEIAHYYATQDSRIRVIAAPHQGRGIALAEACAMSRGTYLGLVDSDDLLAETALEETVQLLDLHPDIGLVYSDYIIIDENDNFKSYGQHCEIPYSKDRLLTEFMVFHFRLLRRTVYDNIGGFNPQYAVCQDLELCLRASEVTDFLQLRKPLYYYRHHQSSISCEKRVEQVLQGKRAIEEALELRGMTEEYGLDFQVFATCTLYRKGL